MDATRIGKYLAELRNEHGFTQEELGEKIGVTNKTISRWENGHYMPPIDIFETLSKLYGVSINEILCGKTLNPEEYQEAAEANIKEALSNSVFSAKEKLDFFKKKWKKEHFFSLTIEMLLIVAAIILGFVYDSGLQFIATIAGMIWSVAKYNQMMTYAEGKVFKKEENHEAA